MHRIALNISKGDSRMNAALVDHSDINPSAFIQGTSEWLALRKTKITATDAAVIMGANHWKTKIQLYHEKVGNDVKPLYINERMQRGIDLEPVARNLFNLQTGWNMQPTVVINDWAMASLDGQDQDTGTILEIKCPGEKDHAEALSGRVPAHYYPQLQHQMWVSGTFIGYYFSFDGIDGVTVKVLRDEEYIQNMIPKLYEFYLCIKNETPPAPDENDYVEKDDEIWRQCALKWLTTQQKIKLLEKEAEELKQQLIFLSGESNARGAGISLCQVTRKGTIQYAKAPQLKGVDLEYLRSPSTTYWKLS